ncbi:MAG TPA: urea ABC transporter permease subunit UrtB [Burkholderiales bacterium]|nr:urea ABC transporter permease subunit UrtB [Burkholderiales bacterium]
MFSGGSRAAAAIVAAALFIASGAARALDRDAVEKLAFGEGDERIAAIAALVAEGDAKAVELLKAFAAGDVQTSGKRVFIVRGEKAVDPFTGVESALPAERDDVVANNRLRAAIGDALAVLNLLSPEKSARLAAAKALAGVNDAAMYPLIEKALAKESDAEIRALLEMTAAGMQLNADSPDARLAAIRLLGRSSNPNSKTLLLGLASDADPDIRREARMSLEAVEKRLAWGEWLGLAFAGVSLGSILLLAALGLAITYGLMGVINMAHGELIMIGAYSAYVVQNLFRAWGIFDWYLVAAVPASFIAAGLVGMALERSVIRWLYGRPLETLLATWGLSLILIQAVRTVFGAQNVQVENPAFMSGGIQVLSNVVLPWSRIYIVLFAVAVLAAMWLLLAKTRLGLFIRGVTQNRAMASCVGVPTGRVDAWAFGLGSGIAGLAGCALSQLGNVGPDLGQGYIVDSFLVVVFGGVGQLAGTVYAALVLGFANKLLESWSGAVLAKIAVLVFIIIFIQRRPQGLFALRGRVAD